MLVVSGSYRDDAIVHWQKPLAPYDEKLLKAGRQLVIKEIPAVSLA
jgi:hypothetical protein